VSEIGNATGAEFVKAAFGSKNRNRLIDEYFYDLGLEELTAPAAWEHVYQLLLWADQSNGLAHCYESDKSQPGKNWYSRSLAFHDWLSTELAVEPAHLAERIDWLFRRATTDLAVAVLRKAAKVAADAERQRQPYEGKNFPKPGEDPELISIIRDTLGEEILAEPVPEKWQLLVQRIRQYLALENKRKNLVGEGFEDVLAHVIKRTCKAPSIDVHARRLLHDLPGFNRNRQGEKANKADVAILRGDKRTLVTVKWSVRADREKQFAADFADYVSAESSRTPFEYVFVTNEFDPARLMRACDQLAGNAPLFTHVVHINTEAVKAVYGVTQEPTMRRVLELIHKGRLIGLGQWLGLLDEPI